MKILKISKKIKKPDGFSMGANDEIIIISGEDKIILDDKDMEKIMIISTQIASNKRNLAIAIFSAGVTAMLNSFPDDLKTRVNSLARHLKLI
jgi:hypothetical protein